MKNASSEEFDDMPIDFSFIDNKPKPEKPIHGLMQYLNYVANKQNFTNHGFSKIQEELSRLEVYMNSI